MLRVGSYVVRPLCNKWQIFQRDDLNHHHHLHIAVWIHLDHLLFETDAQTSSPMLSYSLVSSVKRCTSNVSHLLIQICFFCIPDDSLVTREQLQPLDPIIVQSLLVPKASFKKQFKK